MLISKYLINYKKIDVVEIILYLSSIIFIVISIVFNQYLSKMIMSLLSFITILSNLIIYFAKNDKIIVKSIISLCSYSLSFLICVALFINVCNPDLLMIMNQNGCGNYPINPTLRIEQKDDLTVYHDVTYESSYPNNTYTVYSNSNSKGIIFYIHGGGLIFGDKDNKPQNDYLNLYINKGYSVVSVDYVLAPQNKFPQALIQINECLNYFVNNVSNYNLTNDKIIVAGDSAGSTLAGLLAIIQTNPEYANKLGVTPALKETHASLRGYISISGLVDISRFGNTGNIFVDWYFDTMARSALNDINYATNVKTKELGSVLHNINSDFIPTYISDGNFGSFTDQNYDLINKLNNLNIECDYYIPKNNEGIYTHAWEIELDKYYDSVIYNFNKTIDFIEKHMI